ncbi:uncharacterized protein METZ01_LOCUS250798, partial [marine metagenome]
KPILMLLLKIILMRTGMTLKVQMMILMMMTTGATMTTG